MGRLIRRFNDWIGGWIATWELRRNKELYNKIISRKKELEKKLAAKKSANREV